MNTSRDNSWDSLRGIGIVLVVLGHSANKGELLHDFIFLFHMPLFFLISGALLKQECNDFTSYKKRFLRLMNPYLIYLLLDYLVMRKEYSFTMVIHLLWGGRFLSSVYWYITAFLFALLLFILVQKYIPEKLQKPIILAGGMAVIESNIIIEFANTNRLIGLLKYPGIPWNLDVSLLVLVYLAIGFYYKEQIKSLLHEKHQIYDITAICIAIVLVILCYLNYRDGMSYYYFDMKQVYYRELILSIVVPCAFGLVLVRLVYSLNQIKFAKKIMTMFSYLGRMTIPIMFLHVPLNNWKDTLGYGRLLYALIGIGIPVTFTLVFNRFEIIRKLFGLSKIE